MAAYDYDYLGDLLKKVGGLMTQQRLGSGISVTENPPGTWVSGTMVRDGPELTVSWVGKHYFLDDLNITEVGVYYQYDSTNIAGRAIYSEEGLSDVWAAEEAYMTINSVITFTR